MRKDFSFFKNRRGVILITVYLVAAILLILGAAFLIRVIHEANISERDRHATEALYIAEGAVQQILFDLRRDMSNSSDWFDNDINGMTVLPTMISWTTIPYVSNAMGDGTFLVELQGKTGNTSAMLIRTTGTSGGVTRRLLIHSEMINLNSWNNVIFSGAGQSGNAIDGNVDIRGSVHILGTSLSSTDLAMDLDGSANIGNNYNGMPAVLRTKLPPPPMITFNAENVESLGAEVRIKKGKLGLSGAAYAGTADVTGNSLKETLNGLYITNGYDGNKGAANVNSDNGTSNSYDADDAVTFQNFSNSFKDGVTVYPTYTDYVQAKGLNLSAYGIGTISADTPNFGPYTDGNGNQIKWVRSTGMLDITGVVYVNSTLDVGKKDATVLYRGIGTMVALGASSDIKVHGDLLSNGVFATTDAMAFVSQRNVEITTGGGETQVNVAGVFYAQNEIKSAKQNQLAGIFNSNHFDMDNVPSIYQVPSFNAANHPGLIAREPIFFMKISSWQEVQ